METTRVSGPKRDTYQVLDCWETVGSSRCHSAEEIDALTCPSIYCNRESQLRLESAEA